MKTILSFILFAFIAVANTFAQNSLSGKITDAETKEPLIGANIYFPVLKKGTTTDKEGFFKIENLPVGKFLVSVSYIGYAAQTKNIEISGETAWNVEMSPSVMEVGDIVVTGVSAATERNQNPIPSAIVSKEELSENSSTNIIDAVAKKPGVSQVTTGAGISKPVIRGLGYNRVLVLNNNIRQEGQQWGDEHGIEIDEFSVDRVEIIKGPGSLMYGSDAMAGVLNLLPPNPPQQGKITGNLETNYQTNNGLFGFSAMNAGNLNGYNWLLRASRKQAGNYSNDYDGKVFNSGFDELNFNGSFGIIRKWGHSSIYFNRFTQNIGLVEGERDSSGNFIKEIMVNDSTVEEQSLSAGDLKGYHLDFPKQNIVHNRILSDNLFILGKSRLALNLGWQQNHRKELELQMEGGNEPALYFLLTTLNYDAKFFLPELKGWETSIGIGGIYQANENKAKEFLIPAYHLLDAGAFVFAKKSFGKIHLTGGLRYDHRKITAEELLLDTLGMPTTEDNPLHEHKFEGFTRNFSSISGSIGFSYELKKNSVVKLNISRGFRSPNIAELSSNGAHEGTFRYEIGDPSLKPETSLQADAGLVINTEHVSMELDAFGNAISDFIFSRKLVSVLGGDSLVEDEGNTLTAFQFVQGDARLYGGEISVDIHPHPLDWLHFENAFSIVMSEQFSQPDSSRYLPFTPAPRLQSEIKASFKKAGKIFRQLYAKVEMEYYLEQNKIYSAYNTETLTPSYALLHAGIGSNVVNKKGNTLFSVHLSVNNLLDAAYQHHLSRLKYAGENPATGRTGIYNMGKNFSVKLIAPFNSGK